MANNVTRYHPFSEVVSLRDAMDRLFADSYIAPHTAASMGGRGVPVNLFETPDSLIVQIPMPGVKAEDVEITAQQNTLSLKWTLKVDAPEGAATHWNGFQSGQFQQTFTLPTAINADRAEASTINGILTLTLPKAEHAKAKTLKVTAR